MEASNTSEKNDFQKEPDKDSLMEELTAEGLYKSLSTISLDSLNSKLDQKKRPTFNPKESYILDLNDTRKEAEISSKDSKDNNTASQANNINVLERLEEYKAIKKEYKSFIFEVSMDFIDGLLKLLDVVIFLGIPILENYIPLFAGVYKEQLEYYYPLLIAFSIDVAIILSSSLWRIIEIYEMKFLMVHGYSSRWKKGDRIVSTGSGSDPRVERDMKERIKIHKIISVIQGAISDIPWIGLKKKPALFTVCPAEIRIGTFCSDEEDSEKAMESAYNGAKYEIGEEKEPSLVLVFMTANMDHEKALKKLDELTGGNVPYSGCTICRGAMTGTQCRQIDDMRLIGIWAISDPEGSYEIGMADLNNISAEMSSRTIVSDAVRQTYEDCKNIASKQPDNPVIQGSPSFVWINPPPGAEDEIIHAINEGIGDTYVEIIGGSSADNDVSGQWKQWNSRVGVVSNGLAYVIAHCSAQLKGCAFTGYSATPKVGIVTKMNGNRHIVTIDNKPAGEVYDEWTSGHFKELWKDPEDSNILGPSSVYPLGQVVSQDWDNEDVYRTLHPHLLVKKDKSVTVFSDVHEGQKICMMTGTTENIQTKISSVATYIMRSTGIPTSELRGALVVFCAGAMMYVGTDGIDIACSKLDQALGGVNYFGIHTFGEQGPFPDGSVRHGNLMFSALVFSSRRKIMKISNVDSEEIVLETDPKFKEIAMNGGIIGRN